MDMRNKINRKKSAVIVLLVLQIAALSIGSSLSIMITGLKTSEMIGSIENVPSSSFYASRPDPQSLTTEQLVLTADASIQREFVYSNKLTGYFTGNTKKINTRHWHGLVVRHAKFMENFFLKMGDHSSNLVLNENSFYNAEVYPERLVRRYNLRGIYHPSEEIFMPDSIDGLAIAYDLNYTGNGVIYIQFDIHDIYSGPGSYSYAWSAPESCFWVKNTASNDYIVVKSNVSLNFVTDEYYAPYTYPLDQQRGEPGTATVFQPGRLTFTVPSNGKVYFSFGIAPSIAEANTIASNILSNYSELLQAKKQRITNLLSQSPINTDNPEFDKALAWAKVSIDSLIMQQYVGGNPAGIGIWAGLHWFPESWSRDLFISFPGAVLCTGSFSDANQLIAMMSNLQDTNTSSPTYGRIPNRMLPGDPSPAYSSADGTPWFIREIYEYFQYTNNLTFLTTNWAVLERAIDGEITKRSDSNNFIKHGSSITGHNIETWMDGAVMIGPNLVPNSPRDDRAVEIQALWYTAIKSGAELAQIMAKPQKAQAWNQFAEKLKMSFQSKFYNNTIKYLIDHLNEDGSEDHRIRPNQLFAISVPWDNILNETQEKGVLDTVQKYLVFPHGITTLNREDIYNWGDEDVGYRGYDFGGLHDSGCYKDPNGHWVGNSWSYHNGMVWPWLSGPAISAFTKHLRMDVASNLTRYLTNLLLYRGTLGSLCEVLPGDEDRPTGATSQAWSLAEYIRVFYQAYLGIRPKTLNKEILINSNLPDFITNASAKIPVQNGSITYSIDTIYNTSISLQPIQRINIKNNGLNSFTYNITFQLPLDRLNHSRQSLEIYVNGQNITNQCVYNMHVYGHSWNFAMSPNVNEETIIYIIIIKNSQEQTTTQNQENQLILGLAITLTVSLIAVVLLSIFNIRIIYLEKMKKLGQSNRIIDLKPSEPRSIQHQEQPAKNGGSEK